MAEIDPPDMTLEKVGSICVEVVRRINQTESGDDVFGDLRRFCRDWLPDKEQMLGEMGVVQDLPALLNFLTDEVMNWNDDRLYKIVDTNDERHSSSLVALLALVAACRCAVMLEKQELIQKVTDIVSADPQRLEDFSKILFGACCQQSLDGFLSVYHSLVNKTPSSASSPPMAPSTPTVGLKPNAAAMAVMRRGRMSTGNASDLGMSPQNVSMTEVFSSSPLAAVPPLRNMRLNSDSPHSKMAQKNRHMKAKYEQLSNEHEFLKSEHTSLDKRYQQLQKENSEKNVHIEKLRHQAQDYFDEAKEASKRAELLDSKCTRYESRISELETQLKKAGEEMSEKETEVSTLKSELVKSKNVVTKQKAAEAQAALEKKELMQQFDSERYEYEQHISKLDAQIASLNAEFKQTCEWKAQLKRQLDEAVEEKEELEATLTQKMTSAVAELEQKLVEAQNAFEEKGNQCRELIGQCASLNDQLHELKLKQLDVQTEHSHEVAGLKNALSAAESREANLTSQLQQAGEANCELRTAGESLRATVNNMRESQAQMERNFESTLKEKVEALESKLRQKEEIINDLNSKMVETRNALSRSSEETFSARSEIQQLTARLNCETSRAANEKQQLTRQLENLQQDRDSKHALVQQLRDTIERIQEESAGHEASVTSKLHEEIRALEEKLNKREQQNQEKDSQYNLLINSLEEKDMHLMNAHEREKEMENKMLTLQQQSEERISQLTVEKKDLGDQWQKKYEEDLSELQSKLSESESQLHEARERLARLDDDTCSKSGAISKLEMKVSSYESEVANLRRVLANTAEQHKAQLESARSSALQQQHAHQASLQLVAELRGRVNQLEEEKKQTGLQGSSMMKIELERAQSAGKMLETSLSSTRSELAGLRNELVEKSQLLTQYETQSRTQQEQTEELRQQMKELEQRHHSDIQQLQMNLQQAQKFNEENCAIKEELKLKITELDSEKQVIKDGMEMENRNLSDAIIERSHVCDQLTREVEDLKWQLQLANTQLDTLKNERELLLEQNKDGNEYIETLSAENRDLDEQLTSLMEEHEGLKAKAARVTSRLHEAENTALEAQSQLTDIKAREGEMKAVHDQLRYERENAKVYQSRLNTLQKLLEREREKVNRLSRANEAGGQQQQSRTLPRPQLTTSSSSLRSGGHSVEEHGEETGSIYRSASSSSMRSSTLSSAPSTCDGNFRVPDPVTSRPATRSSSTMARSSTHSIRSHLSSDEDIPAPRFHHDLEDLPEPSFFTHNDLTEMAGYRSERGKTEARITDLQRRDTLIPRSLIHVSSYPTDTITQSSAVSQSASRNLSQPGSRQPLVSFETHNLKTEPGSDVDENDPDRWSEIERRNSMRPNHLKCSYVIEADTRPPPSIAEEPGNSNNPTPSSAHKKQLFVTRKRNFETQQLQVNDNTTATPKANKLRKEGSGMVFPSPAKLFSSMKNKSRRSRLRVEPMDSVPERNSCDNLLATDTDNHENEKPAFTRMDIPISPPKKVKRTKRQSSANAKK